MIPKKNSGRLSKEIEEINNQRLKQLEREKRRKHQKKPIQNIQDQNPYSSPLHQIQKRMYVDYHIHSFAYVEESIPLDLICISCTEPIQNPKEHDVTEGNPVCSQVYCNKCVEDKKTCPSCQVDVLWNPVKVTPTSKKYLLDRLEQLKVECLKCNDTFAKEDVPNHLCQADNKLKKRKKMKITPDSTDSETDLESEEEYTPKKKEKEYLPKKMKKMTNQDPMMEILKGIKLIIKNQKT